MTNLKRISLISDYNLLIVAFIKKFGLWSIHVNYSYASSILN